jgi:spore cortex formation protein SpoVR/YcgB (stage V sporulation)
MPNPNKYNGWTNYETWLCNLWFDNFDFSDMLDMFDGVEDKDDIRIRIEDYIKEYVEEFVESYLEEDTHGFIHDMLNSSIQEIDFRDIAEHYVDDVASELEDLARADEESEEDNQYHYVTFSPSTAAA